VLDLAKNSDVLAAGLPWSFMDMFLGTIPGCIGETSALLCLVGAVVLAITGIGSARIMLSMVVGGLFCGYLLEGFGANYFGFQDAYFHLVAGGFAFGTVFMATDPVSAAQTDTGKVIYGFMAGVFSILIRVTNPAYPEGVMLGILLANVLAPFIDYYVVQSNKTRRLKRATV
jgi:Na+-transporting NADH:ubiquinone oxidoreductase subunit B